MKSIEEVGLPAIPAPGSNGEFGTFYGVYEADLMQYAELGLQAKVLYPPHLLNGLSEKDQMAAGRANQIIVPAVRTDVPVNGRGAFYGIREPYITNLAQQAILPYAVFPARLMAGGQAAHDHAAKVSGGMLTTGGGDFHPGKYGKEKHDKTIIADPERDDLLLHFLRNEILIKLMPYFGICLGHQALAIACGCKLDQDIPSDHPEVKEEHNLKVVKYSGLLQGPTHGVKFRKNSSLHKVVGDAVEDVNSAHHQAVNKESIEDNGIIEVSADSDAELIEGIEGIDKSHFLVGVQWHPEAMQNLMNYLIFQALGRAVRHYSLPARQTHPTVLTPRHSSESPAWL